MLKATWLSLIEAFFLVFSLSIDTFTSSFAYGLNKIKIPFKVCIVINLLVTFILIVSILFGSLFAVIVSEKILSFFCFLVLFILGFIKLFDSYIKRLIKRKRLTNKKVEFSFFNILFILNIYADPKIADIDNSRDLSIKEAFSLAIALSLDGIAVGIGAGLFMPNIWFVMILSMLIGIIATLFGVKLGHIMSKKAELNLSWVSGLILILLGLSKL